MTKKEIVKTISEEIGMTQLKTKEIVQKTFNAIVDTLVEDHRIELRNFGVFEVKRRAARKARNPRTGEKVYVPEKFVVTFKPGKEMEEKVREMEAPRRPASEHGRRQRSTTGRAGRWIAGRKSCAAKALASGDRRVGAHTAGPASNAETHHAGGGGRHQSATVSPFRPKIALGAAD